MTEPEQRRASAQAKGLARMAKPQATLAALAAHFVEHADVRWRGDTLCLDAGFAWGELQADAESIRLWLAAQDQATLDQARLSLVEHLDALSSEGPVKVHWDEGGGQSAQDSAFRLLQVVHTRDITPRMRRVTLAGKDLGRFATSGLHVRMLFPPSPDGKLAEPQQTADGRLVWPKDQPDPVYRVYTVRHVDAAGEHLDIDMLLHPEDSGPGSDWASQARPGVQVGILGPRGTGLPPAPAYVLLGDETALPAIARLLSTAPAGVRVTVLAEVADAAERLPLTSPATLTQQWLFRGGPGLAASLAAQPELLCGGKAFVWAGCERRAADAIRTLLRSRSHPAAAFRVSAYWQQGHAAQ